jgi:signal transduction histidine kinase
LRIIEDETRQCQRIVQGLLDLARPPRLDRTEVDLAELARDAALRLQETGKLDGIRVEPPPETTHAMAFGDEAKLRQVVVNLLINAVEATQPPGAVTLQTASEDEMVLLAVTDTGCGNPSEVLPRVFDPFFTTKPKGTGLGLAVSQAIVDAHGWRLDIASQPERGTRATLHLPRSSSSKETAE